MTLIPKRNNANMASSSKSIPIDHSHLIVGNILPSTHLKGIISIIWGPFPTATPSASTSKTKNDIPKVSFSIKHTFIIPAGYQPNDYVAPSEKDLKEKYEIKLIIYHSLFHPGKEVGDDLLKEKVRTVSEEDKIWLKDVCHSKEIIVDTTGMKIIKKEKKDTGKKSIWLVELQAVGPRVLQYQGSGSGNGEQMKSKLLMSDFAQPSQTPDWFTSSAPTVSSPPQPSTQPLPPTRKNEQSKFKPLTSFHIPDLTVTRIPSRSSTSSHSSNPPRPTKRPSLDHDKDREGVKRVKGKEKEKEGRAIDKIAESTSPEKAQVLVSGPGKGKEQEQDKEIEKPKQPKTIVQLGPPGFQALVNSRPPQPVINKDKEQESSKLPLSSESTTDVSVSGKIEEEPQLLHQLHLQPHLQPQPQPPAQAQVPAHQAQTPLQTQAQPAAEAPNADSPINNNLDSSTANNQKPKGNTFDPIGFEDISPLPSDISEFPINSRATPLKEISPIRPPPQNDLNGHYGASSPLYPSRRQSIPTISQSSPSTSTAQVQVQAEQRERLALARKRAEEQRRGEIQAAQAESSRIAQAIAADVEKLERPLVTNDTTYTPLRHLTTGKYVNIIGVVVKTTGVTKPVDYMISIILCDPTRHANGDPFNNEELVVSIFRPREIELPLDVRPGDVMLFRGLKISIYNGKTKGQAYSGSHNTWVILKNGKEIKFANKLEMIPPLTRVEVDRMVELYNWSRSDIQNGQVFNQNQNGFGNGEIGSPNLNGLSMRRSSSDLGSSRDDIVLGQVVPSMFFNAVFKIIHAVRNPNRKPDLELYITDGTCCPPSSLTQLRNFHNIQIKDLPPQYLYSLAIHDLSPLSANEMNYFEIGNILKLNNVRSKIYKGEFELSWSELPTSDQALRGWKRRKCSLIRGDDERAKTIESRLRAIKSGEAFDEPLIPPDLLLSPLPFQHQQQVVQQQQHQHEPIENFQPMNTIDHIPSAQPTNQSNFHSNPAAPTAHPIRLATHIRTIYTDPTEHPISSISDILYNPTIPNKYRIIAQVKSIHSRSLPSPENNDVLIQSYCNHCKSNFKGTWCQSCNDYEGEHSEFRYRFLVILKDQKGDEMACLVADDEAAEFLPPLPPWSNSTNPNDLRKSERRKIDLSGQVYNILQGAKMDNVRTKPFLEISLEVYQVTNPSLSNPPKLDLSESGEGDGRKGKGERVVVARMFGMSTKSQ